MLSQKHQQISVYALFAGSVTWPPAQLQVSLKRSIFLAGHVMPGNNWDPVGLGCGQMDIGLAMNSACPVARK